MGRPAVVTKTLAAASANNISLSQSGTAGTPLLLNGSTGGVLDTQRRVFFTFAADETGHNFTVIGTAQGGYSIKEVVAGTATTAATNLDFLTVTSIVPSANTAGALTVGTNTVGSSPWQQFDMHIPTPNLSLAIEISGTVNCSVEYTYDEFKAPIPNPISGGNPAIQYAPPTVQPVALLHPTLQGKTSNADGAIDFAIMAWRLTINSGTGTGTLTGIQAGISGP